MWKSQLTDVEVASTLAGATLLSLLFAQHLFTRQSELYSEILCWTLLPIFLKVNTSSDTDNKATSTYTDVRRIPSIVLWLIAGSLTIVCVYKAENGIVELQPLLTPLLLVVQNWRRWEFSVSNKSRSRLLSPLFWGTTLCAFIAVLAVFRGNHLGAALSILAVTPQLFVYSALLPKDAPVSRLFPVVESFEDDLERLCWRAVASLTVALCVRTSVIGLTRFEFTHALSSGVIKAVTWLFVFRMRQHTSWCIAPSLETFSLIASIDPFSQSSETQAVFNVLASGTVLAQSIHMLPKQSKARMGLWLFLLTSIVPYLADVRAIKEAQLRTQQSFGDTHEHPAETLFNNAKANFGNLLHNQSKSYAAACDEYRRRYGAEPPHGFEDWFNFAVSHHSAIVDDFDTIYTSVSPFWKLSGAEVLHIMTEVQAKPDWDLWSCTVSAQNAQTRCSHPSRTFDRHIGLLFNRLTGNLSIALPDVKFLVNHLDEPRVLFPLQSSIMDDSSNSNNKSKRPVWDALTRKCPSEQRKAIPTNSTFETFGLSFVTALSSIMDLCGHPEYEAMHGLLAHPASSRMIQETVPVLSTGSLSTMGDVLYPSPAYLEADFQYDETQDVEWEKKQNKLYWTGSTTGGQASNDEWRYFHRQRFVSLAQNLGAKRHVYLREIEGVVTRVASHFLNSRLFDVAFTRIFQCDARDCRDQRAHFNIKPWADRHSAFRSKLAFDMDGNGISGRYYQLLASKSVPLKQTLLREWHDDRLVPWAHYIPISQSLDEVPELVSYLTSSDTGKRIAKEIAGLGRNWHSQALREIDITIYTYRLLLELARLQDLERSAG